MILKDTDSQRSLKTTDVFQLKHEYRRTGIEFHLVAETKCGMQTAFLKYNATLTRLQRAGIPFHKDFLSYRIAGKANGRERRRQSKH